VIDPIAADALWWAARRDETKETSMASTIRIGAHVKSVIDADGAVILDLKRGRYFSLNGTGVSVWRRLEGGVTPEAIEAEFSAQYAGAPNVGRDVTAFVESLRRAELIDVSE
jgi:hypothetical protein